MIETLLFVSSSLDGSLVAPLKVPPLPSLAPTSTPWPSESPLPISIDYSTKSEGVIVRVVIIAFIVGICLLGLLFWCVFFRRPLRVFISHEHDPNGPEEIV